MQVVELRVDCVPRGEGVGSMCRPVRKAQLAKRQKDFILCMELQDSLPCTIKQIRNQLCKQAGWLEASAPCPEDQEWRRVTEEEWMETAKQLYEDNRCHFGFTSAGIPFEVWF